MSAPVTPRRSGAPRNETVRLAILRAASELIASEGYDHLTIEGIAARAGVGKPTIYRWWSSKSVLIAECLFDATLMPAAFRPNHSADITADLTEWLLAVFRFANQAANGALIRSLIAAAVDNPDVAAQLSGRLGAAPEALGRRLQAAVDSGQLPQDTAIGHISELLIGATILRVVSAVPFEDRDAALFVRTVLAGSLAAR